MVELTVLEKELWKRIQELPINHKDFMKRGDMKIIQNKRKLLEQLKQNRSGVSFYYHIEFKLFSISTEGWYPYGPEDFEMSVDMGLEKDAMLNVKKITFTGKWD